MKTENVRYDADGLQMIGHFAYDEKDSKKRPAVLIFPEAFGLGDHAKKRAERSWRIGIRGHGLRLARRAEGHR